MSQLVEIHGLTEAQAVFVDAYVQSGDVGYSANMADRSVRVARAWMRDPKVNAAIQAETKQRLSGGALMALDVVLDLARNENTDDKVRLSAARDILDRAGFKPEHLHTSADRRLDNQGVSEVLERVNELQRELGMNASSMVVPNAIDAGGEDETPEPPEPPKPDDSDPTDGPPEPPPELPEKDGPDEDFDPIEECDVSLEWSEARLEDLL